MFAIPLSKVCLRASLLLASTILLASTTCNLHHLLYWDLCWLRSRIAQFSLATIHRTGSHQSSAVNQLAKIIFIFITRAFSSTVHYVRFHGSQWPGVHGDHVMCTRVKRGMTHFRFCWRLTLAGGICPATVALGAKGFILWGKLEFHVVIVTKTLHNTAPLHT